MTNQRCESEENKRRWRYKWKSGHVTSWVFRFFFFLRRSGSIPQEREQIRVKTSKGICRKPCQVLFCAIWRHTGTSGCLATSSLAPRPGTGTWCPVGRGLRHLCQLSVKAHTEAMSRSWIPSSQLSRFLFSQFMGHSFHRSHQRGKHWTVLSLLRHCSHSACFLCLHQETWNQHLFLTWREWRNCCLSSWKRKGLEHAKSEMQSVRRFSQTLLKE